MNKREAIRAMLDGENIQHSSQKGTNIFFAISGDDRFRKYLVGGSHAEVININLLNTGDCWHIYEEPKVKVKMWQWIHQLKSSADVKLSRSFYPDTETARQRLGSGSDFIVLKKADWTEIEIDQ